MESKLGFIYLCKENDVHALTVIHENSKLPNDNLYYMFFLCFVRIHFQLLTIKQKSITIFMLTFLKDNNNNKWAKKLSIFLKPPRLAILPLRATPATCTWGEEFVYIIFFLGLLYLVASKRITDALGVLTVGAYTHLRPPPAAPVTAARPECMLSVAL